MMGESESLVRSTRADAILAALRTTDSDRLYVHQPDGIGYFGWIDFVYGNGCDVLSDNTVNLELYLKPISELADQLESSL